MKKHIAPLSLVLACSAAMAHAQEAAPPAQPVVSSVITAPLSYFPQVRSRAEEECKTAGGEGITYHGPFISSVELNADDKPDYVLDSGVLACTGKPDLWKNDAGSPLLVLVSGADGWQPVWQGRAKSWRKEVAPEGPRLLLTLSNPSATPPVTVVSLQAGPNGTFTQQPVGQ